MVKLHFLAADASRSGADRDGHRGGHLGGVAKMERKKSRQWESSYCDILCLVLAQSSISVSSWQVCLLGPFASRGVQHFVGATFSLGITRF